MCTGKARRHRTHRLGVPGQGAGDQPAKSFKGPKLQPMTWGQTSQGCAGTTFWFPLARSRVVAVSQPGQTVSPRPCPARRPGVNTPRQETLFIKIRFDSGNRKRQDAANDTSPLFLSKGHPPAPAREWTRSKARLELWGGLGGRTPGSQGRAVGAPCDQGHRRAAVKMQTRPLPH